MNKVVRLLTVWFSLFLTVVACNQETTTNEKMSVEERMAKARAMKAQRQFDRATGKVDVKAAKATPGDYQTPVDKVLKGPNGEVVHVGERGAKFYINKNGNKTYLSSNQ